MTKQNGFTVVELVIAVVMLVGMAGWIWNIVKLAGSDFAQITGMLVLRGLGVVMPPLGAVMGFL